MVDFKLSDFVNCVTEFEDILNAAYCRDGNCK